MHFSLHFQFNRLAFLKTSVACAIAAGLGLFQLPSLHAQSIDIDINSASGEFANYSTLVSLNSFTNSMVGDATVTFSVGAGTAPLWSTAGYSGAGTEIDFQQRGGPATTPALSFAQGTYLAISLDTTAHGSNWIVLEKIAVDLHRNGPGAPNNFQFAYSTNGVWDTNSLIGTATNFTPTTTFTASFAPGTAFTMASQTPQIRLYYWDNDGTVSATGNTHVTRVAATYAITNDPGIVVVTPPPPSTNNHPNILFILCDDMGFSDLGCYGSEIQTPNLDSLAQHGLRFANFYNHAKCEPTRISIPRGAYAQQPPSGGVNNTLAQNLNSGGYATLFVGKSHQGEADVAYRMRYAMIGGSENHFNPGVQRDGETQIPAHGDSIKPPANDWLIDNVKVDVTGGTYKFPTNYYSSITFVNKAIEYLDTQVSTNEPFFLYLAFTAPHYPLQAYSADKAVYTNVYDVGWDVIRTKRFARQKKLGLFADSVVISPTMPNFLDWTTLSATDRTNYIDRMQTYAGMIHRVDQEVGRLLTHIDSMGRLTNTIIMFLSDNGADVNDYLYTTDASAAAPDTTSQTSYVGLSPYWANASDTPFRLHKSTVYEGGAHTPCILVWPGLMPTNRWGEWNTNMAHIMDILPTFLDAAGVAIPSNVEGKSLKPIVQTGTRSGTNAHNYLAFQYGDYHGVRQGDFKIISNEGRNWALYNIALDPGESSDLSRYPSNAATIASLEALYDDWSTKGGAGVRTLANGIGTYDGGPNQGAKPVPGNGGLITMSGNNITYTAATDADTAQTSLYYTAFWSYRNNLVTVDDVLAWADPISGSWSPNATSLGGIQNQSIARGQTVYPYVLVRDPQYNKSVYGPGTYTLATSGGVPTPGKITAITAQEPSSATVNWTTGTDATDATLYYALITSEQNNITNVAGALTYGKWVTPFTLGLTNATAKNLRKGTNYFAVLVRDSARNVVITPLATGLTSFAATITNGAYSTYKDYVVRRGSPAALANPDADANGNGRSNFADYALGLDPLASSPDFDPLHFKFSGQAQLTFPADRDLQDLHYRIVANTNLNFITDRTILFDSMTDPWLFNAAGEAQVQDTDNFNKRFYRLELERYQP